MNPTQIKQVLNIRTLRADKAERELNAARASETQALNALGLAQQQLQIFDASYDERIAAFFSRTAKGVTPESLHSSRSFHSDLASERTKIEEVIEQAHQVVALAAQNVANARRAWAVASRAADNLKEVHTKALKDWTRQQARIAEQDADERSVARAFRDAG